LAGIFDGDAPKLGGTEAPLARETPNRASEDQPASKVIGKLPQDTEGAGGSFPPQIIVNKSTSTQMVACMETMPLFHVRAVRIFVPCTFMHVEKSVCKDYMSDPRIIVRAVMKFM
jgi:hypothetical protein